MKAPIGYTCKDIDQCIKWLKICKENIEVALNTLYICENIPGNVIDALDEAHKYCDIEKELEELRSANSALRDWGYELSNELEELKRDL
jgi:hypothetical protein